MAGDIRVVMVTIDRAPRENYLHETINNLVLSGLFTPNRLESLHFVDSGSPNGDDDLLNWPDRALSVFDDFERSLPDWLDREDKVMEHREVMVHYAPARRSGKQNTAAALRIGASGHQGWVLFLEDDLAFCGDFLGSVGRWLDQHEGDGLTRPKRPIYPFSGDHAAIRRALSVGDTSWEYPIQWFWGLQAFACRPAVAEDLAQWLEDHPLYKHTDGRLDENAHDLEMHNWARERDYTHFRGSCPSFVQHIGHETSIAGNVMGGARVTFPTWPGRDWRYAAKQEAAG